MALFCPMGTGKKVFSVHRTMGRNFFHGRIKGKSKTRVPGSEDSHSQSSSQTSETPEDLGNCEKLDYVMKWNASVVKGMRKSSSMESLTNSGSSRSSYRSDESFLYSNTSGSRTSLDSLSKSDENLANWRGRKVYNTVKKTQSMESLKQAENELDKPELESLLSGISCGKCPSVRVKLLWNFEPLSKREMRVHKGEVVHVFSKDKEWVFAMKSDGTQGYIPYNYCTVVRKSDLCTELMSNGVISNRKNNSTGNTCFADGIFSLLRSCSAESVMEKYSQGGESLNENLDTDLLIPKIVKAQRHIPPNTVYSTEPNKRKHSEDSRKSSSEKTRHFTNGHKDSSGRRRKASQNDRKVEQFRKSNCDMVRVLYDFRGVDENDLTVKQHDLLQVLNKEDQDWWWVRNINGVEGFVPHNYVQSVHKRTLKVPGARRNPNRVSAGQNQVTFQEHVIVHCYEALSDENKEEELDTEDIAITDMHNTDCSTWF